MGERDNELRAQQAAAKDRDVLAGASELKQLLKVLALQYRVSVAHTRLLR